MQKFTAYHVKFAIAYYIGQTGKRLADRMTEHLRDIRINSIDKPIVRHFGSRGHNIINLKVCILKEGKNEDHLPFGMTLDFYNAGSNPTRTYSI